MKRNGFSPILLILVVVVLGFVGYFAYKSTQNSSIKLSSNIPNSLPVTSSPIPKSLLEASARPGNGFITGNTEDKSNYQTFSSPDLGIALHYDPTRDPVQVKEVGDKIYYDYQASNAPLYGQFVEVFKKDINQSFQDAIKTTILKNLSSEKCVISTKQSLDNLESTATIEDATFSIGQEQGPYCPAIYISNAGGLAFFYYDSQHPQYFLFYSIGQYMPFWYAEFSK